MDKGLDALFQNLSRQLQLFIELQDCIFEERQGLINADLGGLQSIQARKQGCLFDLESVETERLSLMPEIAKQLGFRLEELTLAKLIHVLPLAVQSQFQNLKSNLDNITLQVMRANRENAEYANHGIDLLNGAMGNIKDTIAPSATYQKQGRKNGAPVTTGGHFVSREA